MLNQIKSAQSQADKLSLSSLLDNVRARLRVLRRGESSRKKRWKIKQANQAFLKNPFDAGKKVLDPICNKVLQCSSSQLDLFKTKNLFDQSKDIPLTSLSGLPEPPILKSNFKCSNFKLENFYATINSRRNASSPGINMIPYKVYKKCTRIASFLFKIFQSVLKTNSIPIQWRIASEVYIPKTKPPDSSRIEDFRPIALLNVEGKLFFSLFSKLLENHIVRDNNLIDLSTQKGCMSKVPGCWEHMSLVWDQLQTVKENKADLAAVWLDIANAYGSIPHQLIFFALERYGIDTIWIDILKSYYRGLWSKSFSSSAPSSWHLHHRGIFAGCTVSIILFLSGMNVILEYITAGIESDAMSSLKSPPVKAFMDDLFLMSPSKRQHSDTFRSCIDCVVVGKNGLKGIKIKKPLDQQRQSARR